MLKKPLFYFLLAAGLIIMACESGPQPKDTVLGFINALRGDTQIELDNYLIVNELVRENAPNVYTYNDSLSVRENINRFSELFAPDGKIRRLWTDKQIVVGETEVLGDTAYVEVSFIDRASSKQYYNKWGLRKTTEDWKIFAFKLL